MTKTALSPANAGAASKHGFRTFNSSVGRSPKNGAATRPVIASSAPECTSRDASVMTGNPLSWLSHRDGPAAFRDPRFPGRGTAETSFPSIDRSTAASVCSPDRGPSLSQGDRYPLCRPHRRLRGPDVLPSPYSFERRPRALGEAAVCGDPAVLGSRRAMRGRRELAGARLDIQRRARVLQLDVDVVGQRTRPLEAVPERRGRTTAHADHRGGLRLACSPRLLGLHRAARTVRRLAPVTLLLAFLRGGSR